MTCKLRVWRVSAIADVLLLIRWWCCCCFCCNWPWVHLVFPVFHSIAFRFYFHPQLCVLSCVWAYVWYCFVAHFLYKLKILNATPLFAELSIWVHISYNCFYYPIYKILLFCWCEEELQMQLDTLADKYSHMKIRLHTNVGSTAAGLFFHFVFWFYVLCACSFVWLCVCLLWLWRLLHCMWQVRWYKICMYLFMYVLIYL